MCICTAIEVELPINERSLVMQERDVCVLQEFIHARVALFLLVLAECEAREHRLFDVMVAVAGVNTIFRPDTAQRTGKGRGLIYCLPFVVKNIARNDNKVCILLIDPLHHLPHLFFTDVIAKMEIGYKHNLHLVYTFDSFVDRHFIRRHMDDSRIDPPQTDAARMTSTHAARKAVHPSCGENMFERQHVTKQRP